MALLALTLKNTTGSDIILTDASGVIVPASGQDSYVTVGILLQLAVSSVLRGFISGGQIVVNNGSSDLSVVAGLSYLTNLFSFAGFSDPPSGFMDYPYTPGRASRFWNIQMNSGLTSTNNSGFVTAPIVNGTATVTHDTDGQWLNYASQGLANRDSGWLSSLFNQVTYSDAPHFGMVIKTGDALPDIQSVRFWFGLFSATPMAASMPAVHLAAFRYDTTVDGTAFWRCVTNDGGGVGTITTTSVAIAVATRYELLIDMSDQASIKFYINKQLVATHTTTLPGAAQNLGHVEQIRALIAVVVDLKLSRIFMEHN